MAKLKGALIGFGNVAAYGHLPNYLESPDFEISAIVDPSPERRAVAQLAVPGATLFASFEELLHDPSSGALDFVDICTPPASHTPLALSCLQRGWHVLCEKPLTLHAAEYELLSAQVLRSGRSLFTVHNWKYAPIFQKAFELLKQGRIGLVWHVELFVQRNSHCKGAEQSASASSTDKRDADWRTHREVAGGGILIDHGWHAFYLLLNLVQAAPEHMLAKMRSSKSDVNALEEEVDVLVNFPSADTYMHLTWRANIRRNSVMIQGETGTLLLDDDKIFLSTHSGDREEIKFPTGLSSGSHHPDWFRALLPEFLEEIKNPAKRGANFREAGWCVSLTSAAYESNLRGFEEVPVLFPGSSRPVAALA